jgi:hypothetical protein
LAQIARDALLELSTPPFRLRPCEVLIQVVHCLELAAIDGNEYCEVGFAKGSQVRPFSGQQSTRKQKER